jgi:hypothetical protein
MWMVGGEESPGLTVVDAVTHGDGGSIVVSAQGDLSVDKEVQAAGAHSTVRLDSTSGNLWIAAETGKVAASGGIALTAGGLVRVEGVLGQTDVLDIKAGTSFQLANAAPLSLTGNSISIQTGQTINVNGTLAARDKVELISDAGNIVITGAIRGRDASGLKQLMARSKRQRHGDRAGGRSGNRSADVGHRPGSGGQHLPAAIDASA